MNIPELNEPEKQLADRLARYPLMFAAPIFFGIPPALGGAIEDMNNATVALLELNGRRLGVTNAHVIDGYRQRFADDNKIICQVGLVDINPLTRLVSESRRYDLAVLDLTDIAGDVLKVTGEVARTFHIPREWPPRPPIVENFVMFGGYPGSRRTTHGQGAVGFGSVSSGGSRVNSVQEDIFTFQINIEKCVVAFDTGLGFGELPGISGSPVMMRRQSEGGIEVFDMVGIFFEYYEAWDVLRARPLTLINVDGSIKD